MKLTRNPIGLVMAACLPLAGCVSPDAPAPSRPAKQFTILTLNVAHGRKDGPNQLWQSAAAIRANLDLVSRLLTKAAPDVVGLQEADGPSFWSGGFDHVEYLARQGK